jgi:hypothetical protein
MFKKNLGLTVGMLLAIIVLTGLVLGQAGSHRSERRLTSQAALRRLNLQQKRDDHDKEEATPVQEGVLTERQRKHSRLFEIPNGKSIKDSGSNNSDVDIGQDVPLRITPRYSGLPNYLNGLTCNSDAVIIGTVDSKSSQLTEKGTYIFTDYELIVDKILKDNRTSSIQQNTKVVVTRGGGIVKLNGRILRVTSDTERPLRVGSQYLLFLKLLPDTGAYSAVPYSGDSTFEIGDGKLTQVSFQSLPLGAHSPTDAGKFLAEVQTATYQRCEGEVK